MVYVVRIQAKVDVTQQCVYYNGTLPMNPKTPKDLIIRELTQKTCVCVCVCVWVVCECVCVCVCVQKKKLG